MSNNNTIKAEVISVYYKFSIDKSSTWTKIYLGAVILFLFIISGLILILGYLTYQKVDASGMKLIFPKISEL